MFKMNRLWEKFFYLLTYLAQGASFLNPTCYSILHQKHHAYSDTKQDPHSPHHSNSIWKMMLATYKEYYQVLKSHDLYNYQSNVIVNKSPKWEVVDNFAKSRQSFILWFFVYLSIYLIINPHPIYYLLLPIHFLIGPIQGAIVNWFGHKLGYRNYNLKDKSKNTLPVDFFLMGELYQNNHHRYGQKANFAHKWFEIDLVYMIIIFLDFVGIISSSYPSRYQTKKILLSMILLSLSFPVFPYKDRPIGKALLEYSIFKIDIYEVSYYRGPDDQEKLVLDYKHNVKSRYSKQAWEIGLAPIIEQRKLKKDEYQWILDNTFNMKKGDKLVIQKNNETVSIYKNNILKATTKNKLISDLIHYPWLGDRPINNELKSKLLGKEFVNKK